MTRSPYTPVSPTPLGWSFGWPEWIRYARHWDGCAYGCGRPQQVISALIPWRHGGARTIGNAVPSCRQCRGEKSTRYLTKWRVAQRRSGAIEQMPPEHWAREFDYTAVYQKHLAKTLARYTALSERAAASRATSYRDAVRYPEDSGG